MYPPTEEKGEAQGDSAKMFEELVEFHGRIFTFRFVNRRPAHRVEVQILDGRGARARPYVNAPVSARTEEEARDRAWQVLRNHAGLDRYLGLVSEAVSTIAPGSRLNVEEDARVIRVDLSGPRRLRFPLTLVREDALDPERSDEELLAFIRTHLEAYLEPAETSP